VSSSYSEEVVGPRPGSLLVGRNDGERPHWGFQDIIMSSYSHQILVDCRYAREISKSQR
jgi:hypothetical protein